MIEQNHYTPEAAIQFEYPSDEPTPVTENTPELLLHLLYSLLECRNPKLKLIAMSYASGIDVSYILGCENTLTSISKKLGVSKQNLHKELKLVLKQYDMSNLRVQGHKSLTGEYKYKNFIRLQTEVNVNEN